jgi:hypothetical protein
MGVQLQQAQLIRELFSRAPGLPAGCAVPAPRARYPLPGPGAWKCAAAPLSRSPDAEQSFRGLGYTMIALSAVGRGDWILRPAPLSQVPASRPRSPGAAIAASPELLDMQ